jgi:phospholipase/lecithinase/hemolysin
MTLSFSKIIVFGDGLSDQGRFGALTNHRYPPSPPFADGRWTNGPTWVEVLAQRLNLPLASADNWAQGGATTGYYNINEPLRTALGLGPEAPIRGVLAQIEAALKATPRLDSQAIYVVWAGGHDFGSYLDYGQPDVVAHPPAANIRQALTRLAEAGAHYIIVGNMPDLGSTPEYYGTEKGTLATRLVNDYNAGLRQVAADLRQSHGLVIFEFDAVQVFTEVALNPQQFGLTTITEAFLPLDYIDFANPLAPAKPLPADRHRRNPDEFMTFWAVAAGRVVHATLGERAAAAIEAGALTAKE